VAVERRGTTDLRKRVLQYHAVQFEVLALFFCFVVNFFQTFLEDHHQKKKLLFWWWSFGL